MIISIGYLQKLISIMKMKWKCKIKLFENFGEVRIIAIRTDWQNELYYGHGYRMPKEYETAMIKNICGATPTNIFI